MALEEKYASEDLIPAGFAYLYIEKGTEFVLKTSAEIKSPSDVTTVQEALRKEREDHKKVKITLAKLGDRDIDAILTDLDKIEEYKLAAGDKIDDDAINKLVNARIEGITGPLTREISTLKETAKENEQAITDYSTRENNRLITDAMREAAIAAKVRTDGGLDDAMLFGNMVMEVRDNGDGTSSVVSKSGVGVTPGLTAEQLLTEIQPKRPNWWKDPVNINARDSNGNPINGSNPFAYDTWNATEQSQLVKDNLPKAQQLADMAGVKIGSIKPPAPIQK